MNLRENQKIGAALVIGGGIAGVQASLDLANSGIKVYLLESSPAIGGRMAQLDKTFPTNDCAMCIVSPKLVEAGRHLNIEILTNSKLVSLSGIPGSFRARIRHSPRYIDVGKCTGCADCAEVCPVVLSNEFNEGLDERRAIYRPYPQAVPNSFLVTKRGTSPCKAACPAETSAQGYVALIGAGRYEEALEVIREYNPFPASVGRVCTHPCEEECSRGKVDSPVGICALKRFVADWVYEHGGSSEKAIGIGDGITGRPEAKVAVVGSGPAGMSCAHHLVRMGYGVTVYESLPVAGGMMRVGIPAYRLPREVLQREIDAIVAEGVELRLNTPVRDINGLFEEGYRAVFLAMGAHEPQRLGIEGEDARGVYHGVPFLQSVSLGDGGGELPRTGERVVVIGGGNTAIDSARTALRLGAREVMLVYRRSREEMPANDWEVEEAEREGVKLELLTAPVSVETREGRIVGVRCLRMELGEADASGRRRPVPVPGSEFVIAADTMIAAVAQAPEISFLDESHGLEISSRGTFVVDQKTLATKRAGIFAGGDVHRGPGILIEAIADGRRGALSIDRYLRGVDLLTAREEVPLPVVALTDDEIDHIIAAGKVDLSPRVTAPTSPVSERIRDFREVELSLTEAEARREAARCLECGICSECHLCVRVCKAGAIDHQDAAREEELSVGSVIAAPGYSLYDPGLSPELGYGRYANVVTSMEFERMLSASGPFGGHVTRPSDHREPKKIAFLQCVGSRDKDHDYCSSVCCMYATKEAVLAMEHIPGVECIIFQMDMRAFSKGFDAYYERGKEKGVRYIPCRISALEEDPRTKEILIRYRNGSEDPSIREERVDMAILSIGMSPPSRIGEFAEIAGIELNAHRFCSTRDFYPLETSRPGVYVCGTFAEPKDIPDTVIQASGAAAKALALLGESRGTLIRKKDYPPEQECPAGEEPRIGVFVCSCGSNIAGTVAVKDVVNYVGALPGVVHVENTTYTCSADSLVLIQKRMRELNLNRLVVASCSPRTHEPLFRETIREVGINPYLFEMANIRDQCSWVHMGRNEEATEKAKHLTGMAVACASNLEPLHRTERSLINKCLVVGGGLAGMTSAVNLADQGFFVYLLEREKELGGALRHIHFSAEGGDPQLFLTDLINRVETHPLIEVLPGYQVADHSGGVGNFQTKVAEVNGPRQMVIEHGTTIIATGGREYRGRSSRLNDDKQVMTQMDLEAKIAGQDQTVAEAKSVVMIQCAGPWDDDPTIPFYCSRICCTLALKNALKLKELNPELSLVILYKDMRTYGFKESIYTRAREKGILFVRFDDMHKPKVTSSDGRISVEVLEPMLRLPLILTPDILVLSQAIVPQEDSKELANIFKFPRSAEGFFLEAHMKLRPVDFAADGLYLCGMAHYPKTINESIAQAQAAAARSATVLSRDSLLVGGVVAVVSGERCAACLTCVRLCPYGVPVINAQGEAEIDVGLCKGCGTCVAECPARAIDLMHFRFSQLEAKVGALAAGTGGG
ncbi:MAG: FAD-dependent oxidoreductase [Deltaproteobacteria bacterium]|nr:FAD-dependent oxidoreductase [Deltaproteobacteria bacterium]